MTHADPLQALIEVIITYMSDNIPQQPLPFRFSCPVPLNNQLGHQNYGQGQVIEEIKTSENQRYAFIKSIYM